MNICLILMILGAVLFIASLLSLFVNDDIGTVLGSIGLVVSVFLFVPALAASLDAWGDPIVRQTKEFRIEQTPYRLIVHVDGRQWTFDDAWTVKQAESSKISRVELIQYKNAWGGIINGSLKAKPVFETPVSSQSVESAKK